MKNKNNWNIISSKYHKSVDISFDEVHYGPCGFGENKYKLLGSVREKMIVELGCGGGQNSIALAKQGANVIGIDYSSTQIQNAKSNAKKHSVSVDFFEFDLNKKIPIESDKIDIIISSFLIEYIRDIKSFTKEINRILKTGGICVICDLHPFLSPHDIINIHQSFRFSETDYFSETRINFDWRFEDGSKYEFERFHRPLGAYLSSFKDANLSLESIIEPRVFDDIEKNATPYYDEYIMSQYKFWKRQPYSIIFKLKKYDDSL